MQIKPALVALLSASLIDFGAAAYCNTSQLIHMDVIGTCDCSPEPKGCSTPCPGCGVTPTKNIRNCNGGCEDSESDCAACGIWFHTLCNCLQHPLNCQNSGTIQKYGAPVWVLLETPPGDHNLVTTTQFLPGIRQMNAGHDEAWLFAQQKFDKTSEALAMNPVVVRTMEQVHIHVCPRNTTTASMLGKITAFSSSKLVQLADDKEMYCLGIDHSVDVKGFAGLVADFINSPPPNVCKDMVGAAIIEDDKSRRWACATTNRQGPLGKVCFH
ncbi:uncharacterized protein G6M90_00g026360 [Metarhizium brunneum]|uniref:Uncharacterized protein n=1 Tax=Metarhizium brunneum TaxID=500148 RepID=A0A7D5UQL1_9HYPO|nr:hypothetical protein G6M90_00g026360 [Metarhizium brunneum]